MSGGDRSVTERQLLLWLALPLLAAAGCATSAPAQTELMRESGVTVTAQAMRIRMRALAPQMIASIELAADEIRLSSTDPVVQRRAIVWKLNTTSALYRALFAEFPAAGLVDCWAMLIQVEQYLATPLALNELGPARNKALAQLERMEGRVEETVRWAAPARDPAKIRAELVRWATAHPVEGNLSARRSLREDLADRTAGPELSTFQSVGVATDSLDAIVARLDFLPTILPKQSIWEAEIAFQDFGQGQVNQLMRRADLALGGVDHMLQWLGGPGLDAFAERQGVALKAAVERERLALISLVDAEQARLGELVARERGTVVEEIRKERIAATADVRQAAAESIEQASLAAKGVIDHLILRLALLFAGSILLWGVVATVVRRRVQRRRGTEAEVPVPGP